MNLEAEYRLSPVQRAIWAAAGEGSRLSARLRVTGEISTARLAEASQAVTNRHEALRLRLVRYPGLRIPLQSVADDDLAARGGTDAAEPEPLSVTLADGPDDSPEIVLSVSELFADTTSLHLIAADLAACYASQPTPEDEQERLQFLDVSEWQYEQAEAGEAGGADRQPVAVPPWRPALPDAPDDGPAAASTPGQAGLAQVRAVLPPTEAARLHAAAGLAQQEPADLLLTAWIWVLSQRRASEADPDQVLPVACYTTGRSFAGTDCVVGPLGHHYRLAVPIPPDDDAWCLLNAVAGAVRETAQRPWPEPVTEPEVAAGFAAVSTADLASVCGLGASQAVVDVPRPCGSPHLTAILGGPDVSLTIRYDPAQVRVAAMDWLLDALLAAVNSLPDALAGALPLATVGDVELALLSSWAGLPSPQPAQTLTGLLAAGIAAATPSAPAVIAADETLTFAQLAASAQDLAVQLRREGVAPRDPVAVLADRSAQTIVALLGVLLSGAVYVPVDPDTPALRLRRLGDAVGARILLVGGSGRAVVGWADADRKVLEISGPASRDIPAPILFGADPAEPGDPAYLIFTSGTSGTPCPVVVEHSSVACLLRALSETVFRAQGPALRVVVNAPFTFDASIKQIIQLACGHTLCLVPEKVRQDGAAFLRYLRDVRADVLDVTPTHLRILLDAADPGDAFPARLLLVGGEAIDSGLWRRLAGLDGTRCVNVYGPTECTVDATWAEIMPGEEPSIGRPLPGVLAWVLDERLRPVPAGVAGELCLAGPQLARGYLSDEEATGRRFVTAPLPGGELRLYRTGDRVRHRRDGRIEYLGRFDQQVKIRGFRVEPAEVEAVLREHQGVADAVVVSRDDGGGARLAGYVTRSRDAAPRLDLDRVHGINPHETRYLHDEIFVQQVYLRHGVTLRDDAVVFDVGANIGMFSLFTELCCPTAMVYAFEPVPEAFAALQRNSVGHDLHARLFSYGLSDTDREADFTHYPGYSVMSGQSEYADAAAEISVIRSYLSNEASSGDQDASELLDHMDEVLAERFAGVRRRCRVRPLSDVIDELGVTGIDLLKIDVQRAEQDVLAGIADRHWPLIRQIVAEVHDAIGTGTEGRIDNLAALAEAHGFDVRIEQDELLQGTDRYTLYAVRPEYAGDPRPVRAAAQDSTAAPLDGTAVRHWLADRLPAHMVPSVTVLEQLPRTANGKIDRRALPSPAAGHRGGAGAGPATPGEEILLEVWRETLGIEGGLGVDDNFFQLGGDSIRGIQMQAAALLRGIQFPLPAVFTHQTVRELAQVASPVPSDGEHESSPAAPGAFALLTGQERTRLPAGLSDAYPMTSLQLGMVLHTELSGSPASYHNVTLHEMADHYDPAALRSALDAIIARHVIARTSFDLGSYGEPLQLVHARVRAPLTVTGLGELADDKLQRRLAEEIERERMLPFRLGSAPLFRVRVLTAGNRWWLQFSEYHAILDGWSLHLLLSELTARYGALAAGQAAALAEGNPDPPSFRRFVELERAARADPETRQFWARYLDGIRPAWLGSPPGRSAHTDSLLPVAVRSGLGVDLRKAAAEWSVPVKSLMCAVHVRALGEAMDRRDVVTGLVVGCRPEEPGADRTLGLFLNTVPLAVRLDDDSLAGLAQRIWAREQSLMGYHRLPLADIQRIAGQGELFDTFVNVTQFHPVPEPTGAPAARIIASTPIPVEVGFALAADFETEPATGEVTLTLQLSSQLIDPAVAERLATRYAALLELAAQADATPLPATGADVPASPPDGRSAWDRRARDLWCELLGTSPVGPGADLRTAGGDSLLALRLVSTMRARHGCVIALQEFLDQPRFEVLVTMCQQAAEASR
jgi:amino acid adenylation domain-containing protein/FkbM family methyltransferase